MMKKNIVHYLTDEHTIACNENMGGASGWRHTNNPTITPVTCKRCLKAMAGMKFDVHIFTIVRVKVAGVIARNQKEAMLKAEERVGFNGMFDSQDNAGFETEWGEEHSHALVDVVGDEEYRKSRWYKGDLKTPMRIDGERKKREAR